MDTTLQISFMPWVKLEKISKLGPIIFWPYYAEVDQKVTVSEIKAHLDKYFRSYVDYQGKPVDTITVCSHNDINFHNLSDSEYQDLRNVVDTIIFIAITTAVERGVCANNNSLGPPSANIFEVITQNFTPGNNYIAVQEANVIHGGWSIGEITFPKPWATGGAFWSLEEELVNGFDKCWSAGFPGDVRERLFRSLEWFRMAHIEGGQVSMLTKVVMMASAFEILLQFPKNGKRKYFVDYMEQHVASVNFLKDNRLADNGKSFTLSLAGCWAWDFYELRSRIVHGDHVSSNGLIYHNWFTHLIVADLVFLECIKRELFNHGCIGNDVHSTAKEFNKLFQNQPEDTAVEPLARFFLGFNDVHKALGWVPKTVASPN